MITFFFVRGKIHLDLFEKPKYSILVVGCTIPGIVRPSRWTTKLDKPVDFYLHSN